MRDFGSRDGMNVSIKISEIGLHRNVSPALEFVRIDTMPPYQKHIG